MPSSPAGRLRLADLEFDLDRASVSGWIGDPYWIATYGDPWDRVELRWSVDVVARARRIDDHRWAPRFEFELDAAPARWFDLAGSARSCDEEHGNLYVVGHEPLRASRLSLGERDGTRFALRWQGRCDVGWNARYGRDLPFEIEAWAEFDGILVRGSGHDADADFDARLAAAIDPTGLARQPTERADSRYESGVAMASARWVPR